METHKKRSFIIDNVKAEVNMIEIYRKYVASRPSHSTHRRLFMCYQFGRCSNQVVGKNAFGKIPSNVAQILNLESPKSYTGHCFRRTSNYMRRSGVWWPCVTIAECHFADTRDQDMEIDDDLIPFDEVYIKVEQEDIKGVANSSGCLLDCHIKAESVDVKPDKLVPDVASFTSKSSYGTLPEKSKKLYDVSYTHFKNWCEKNGAKKLTENVLLAYFAEKSETWKSSSLYSEYSKLKTSLAVRGEGDIKTFTKLTEFLKRKSIGYRAEKSRKSKIFSRSQINRFLLEAPDAKYLMMKVAMSFGIAGACCSNEFVQMTLDNIEDKGSVLTVNLPQVSNKKRSFIIYAIRAEVNVIDMYRKYVSLRPPHTVTRRFFLCYKNGKCFNQTVGVNTFGKIPSEVAKYLKLESPTSYNGYCYKRTSKFLRRSGGWPLVTMRDCRFSEDDACDQDMDSDDDVILVKEEDIKIEPQDMKDTGMGSKSPELVVCQTNVQSALDFSVVIKHEN